MQKHSVSLQQKDTAYGRHQISQPMRIIAPIFFSGEKNLIRNNSLFLRLLEFGHKCSSPPVEHLPRMDLRVCRRVHQSTSQTPPTRGRSMFAIQDNSLFLGLYESVIECTSPLVKHIPRLVNPCMQSRTSPRFRALRVGQQVHQSTSRIPVPSSFYFKVSLFDFICVLQCYSPMVLVLFLNAILRGWVVSCIRGFLIHFEKWKFNFVALLIKQNANLFFSHTSRSSNCWLKLSPVSMFFCLVYCDQSSFTTVYWSCRGFGPGRFLLPNLSSCRADIVFPNCQRYIKKQQSCTAMNKGERVKKHTSSMTH